jgi:hypothetical protein
MRVYFPWNAAVGDSAEMPWTEADTENLLGLQTPFTACPVLYRLSEVTTASAEDCNNEPGTQELKLGFVSKLDAESDNPLFIFMVLTLMILPMSVLHLSPMLFNRKQLNA